MHSVWVIAKRELYAYLVSPIAYLVSSAFVFLCGLFFVGGIVRWQDATLQPMFGSLSVVLLFVAPVLTMRLLSRERDQGTIELLLTAPVRDWEVIAGKFVASYAFYAAMIAVTLLYVPILYRYSDPDLATIASGYLGLALLGATMLALGVLASSLTRSQVVAAVIGVVAGVTLWLLDVVGPALGAEARKALAYLAPSEHYFRLTEGIVDTRDVAYFVSATFVFLFLASQVLQSRKWQR